MSNWRTDITQALDEFVKVAKLAGVPSIEIEYCFQKAPHTPPTSLPKGKMAVYGFYGKSKWLKIGKADVGSDKRYTTQHYYARGAKSTLANSLANDSNMKGGGFNRRRPGQWVKSSCHRVNILLPAKFGRLMLALLEAFLHCRLRPRYEG